MKKRVLIIAAIAAAVFTSNDLNAQDFKPAGGEKNVEVNFTPLGGSPISINSLRFRYFKSADMAFRFSLGLSSTSTTTPTEVAVSADDKVTLEDEKSNMGFSIAVGVEKHFEGTDRLSPYVGGELSFSSTSSTDTDVELNAATTDLKDTYTSETTDGSTTFGLNVVLGTDWYFSKSIYMGTEVGLGFATTSNSDKEVTNPGGPDTKTATSPGASSLSWGTNFNSAIRLGFLF